MVQPCVSEANAKPKWAESGCRSPSSLGRRAPPHKPPIVHLGRGQSTGCFKRLMHRVFHMGPSIVGRIRSLHSGGASGCPVWAELGWAGVAGVGAGRVEVGVLAACPPGVGS